MRDRSITIIIAVIVAIISGIVSGIVSSSYDNENFQKEMDLIKSQADSQEKRWEAEDKTNMRVLETLDSIKNNLEIKSEISVKVIPESPIFHNTVTKWFDPDAENEVEIVPYDRPVTLFENQTIRFDIYITNVGLDTTFVNRHTDALALIDGQNYTKSLQTFNRHPNGTSMDDTIGKILHPNSDPLIIPFWIEPVPYLAPSGKILFTVFYDDTKSKTGVIKYIYKSLEK